MSQTTTVSITRDNNGASRNVVLQPINWSKIKRILQSALLITFPIVTIILSVQTDFLFMKEIISGVCVLALLAFVSIAGGRS